MITSEKLVGSENYLSWSAFVELWFMGQGYEDHLVTQEADIPEVERVQGRKIDAQLCSVLWQSVDPKILLHLRAYKTCFKFWTQAKGLYTNDIQRLYKVASAIIHISQQDLDLSTYIGQIASLKEEFLTVMPLTPDVGVQQTQFDKFFMVFTLIGLRPDLEPVRDQILGSPSVPSLDDVFARLLRISSTQTLPSDSISDSSVLVSHTTSRGGRSGNQGRGQRSHCTYCNKLGHTRDRCYQLHGRPPRTTHVAQSSNSQLPQPPSSSASQASQASVASVAQPAKGIGLALPLPSLPLTSVFILLNDRSTGKTIGIGHESQGLYHLTSDSSPAVCISTDAPLLIHSRLGHPSLSKFQKMVPRFSTLSSLSCESCQLGKHTRVSFPKRLNNRAKSPFELVHTDVWGPCRTASTLGFQYFVTFIDDYSRCTCPIYFIYVSSWDSSSVFLCSYSSQNGVAERKNRHLVETARTILLHNSSFPSLPDQPLYFLPPRVFGCTCFVHILTLGQDKLSAKAMKCLFLGYSRLQKGYRCYSLETHRYFISADVTFFEDSPFFSTTSESLPVSEVLPLPIVSPSDVVPPRPLQVYHRRPSVAAPLPFAEAPADSLPIPSASPAPGSAFPPDDLPHCYSESLSHPGWRQAMVDEMATLHSNGTWDLVVLPSGKSTVGCRWVYAVKVGPDGQVDRLKARLVAKSYTQLDIKMSSFMVILAEEVYMEQPPSFVAQGESGLVCRLRCSLHGLKQSPRAWFGHFSSVVQEFGMLRSTAEQTIQFSIIITPWGSTKDLGKLKYFLGIEIAQSSSGVVLSQRKYALDILEETGMLDCKPIDTPMDPNAKLVPGQGEPLGDPGRYRRLVGKLNYLTITRPDISFPVSVVSQFLQSPCDSHWDAVIRILRYIKVHQAKVCCTRTEVILRLLVTQMQIELAHPQIDVLLQGTVFLLEVALHIASNPVFHEMTKHIEVDCHFIREKIASGCVATSFVNSNDQLADIFTKSLRGPKIKYICNKLSAYDVYAPA
ncbi:Retrovirus-related Pol polyprotein from transposon TNT 1-94 [Vitis vinifera]|uniref:Retrovirus-related Pol polyprotein from transposon TNT 1-94 n=1 Tax=Vitis vinifera TaxID=29760 RepID=A0A438HQR1_VITVI|nr:Retrovirus-related Pol polyprotein from transposon TNT 1-94 [Vitis vinifera]